MIATDIHLRQQARFHAVSRHFLQTPFYRQKLGVAPALGLEHLSELPFTTKDELRATPAAARSPYPVSEVEYVFASSGTTGPPTEYYWTREDTAVLRQVGGEAMRRVGVSADDLVLVLAPLGMPVMWYCMVQQYNAAGAGIIMPGLLPPDTLLTYLIEYPITVLITLPVIAGRLFEYAQHFRPEALRHIHLRQVHCGGDFLTQARRRRIEQSWGVACYNFLGMSEILGPLAAETPAQDGLHLAWEHIHLELIDPETRRPVPPGRPGVAVYTTLWPKGAPLLRYWSDDFVALARPDDHDAIRLRYLGRASDRLAAGDHDVFVSDVEECVLAYPVGDEWRLELAADSAATLRVESPPGAPLPAAELCAAVSRLIARPVTLATCPPGSLPRDEAKPNRIVRPTGAGEEP